MQRYKITLEYDGTGLAGWQKQKDHPSVQQHLEEAIEKFCQEKVDTVAAGRTDAGVHARGQVAHFDLNKEHDIRNVQHGINYHLDGLPISVLSAEKVNQDFSARFSATKRHYRYHIINRSAPLALNKNRAWHVPKALDINSIRQAAELLLGNHDFTSFRATECQAKSPVKTLDEITVTQDEESIYFDISAKSFLHHMVRNIVGTLTLVGHAKWTKENVQSALEGKDRTLAGPTAPACGLYFMRVDY